MAIEETEINRWLFEVFLRRESLEDFEAPIVALAKLCRNRDEFELIAHTIEKLVALSQPQFNKQITSLVSYIKRNVMYDAPIAIVATAWGDKPDSSQQLVQLLKPYFRSYKSVSFFNSVNNFEKKNNIEKYPRFILVDEFSGTGNTIIGRVRHISQQAKSRGSQIDPYVGLLFGMENALEAIRAEGINVHFCGELKAGISGYFSGDERERRINIMKRLEEELSSEWDGEQLPSLGYGAAEALFFVKNMNAPNSNFPIFWWPYDATETERETLMRRAEP
ncbi:phosphoribosyltransferase-like protein [Brucella anthropi]|uniref:phosphoribosyltransferase-like protein n=1 Tax=Brucella anthropi TaxID=529 RepID=UPI00125D7875|nr:hypothetical protein [Brucella anthropi]QFP63331.1 hypothetical protein FT787_09560 [Brucella anthropi]